jgi:SAM-dependent methyltransferase
MNAPGKPELPIDSETADRGEPDIQAALRLYQQGLWRALVWRDLILADVARLSAPVILDIGCGGGFDDDARIQHRISTAASLYVGVEPDPEARVADCFHEVHRGLLEDVALAPNSVDVAYAVSVLEHVEKPDLFFAALHRALRDGGVFWGFTMDGRHYFRFVSQALEFLGAKKWFLNRLHGSNRYHNYRTVYRANMPGVLRNYLAPFARVELWSWGRIGQLQFYWPQTLHAFSRSLDRIQLRWHLPGSMLIVRAQK